MASAARMESYRPIKLSLRLTHCHFSVAPSENATAASCPVVPERTIIFVVLAAEFWKICPVWNVHAPLAVGDPAMVPEIGVPEGGPLTVLIFFSTQNPF